MLGNIYACLVPCLKGQPPHESTSYTTLRSPTRHGGRWAVGGGQQCWLPETGAESDGAKNRNIQVVVPTMMRTWATAMSASPIEKTTGRGMLRVSR